MDHLLSMEKETFCLVLEEFLPKLIFEN